MKPCDTPPRWRKACLHRRRELVRSSEETVVLVACAVEIIHTMTLITREIESNIVKCEEIESELATKEAELIKTSVMLQFDTVGYVTVAGHDYTHEGVDDIEPSSSL
ncbi:hypothetical protein SESBI_45465 [Sesbania bispinosa]|nr:hypothetical protein SESBI_45465 [Sesbania bispinosa]